MELEIVPFRPDIGPPKYANCLFSSNFESEMLHLSCSNRKWALTIGEGGEISSLLPPPLAAPLGGNWCGEATGRHDRVCWGVSPSCLCKCSLILGGCCLFVLHK